MRKLLAIAAFLLCALTAQAQTGVTTVGPVTINGGATLGGAPAASFTPVFSSAGSCSAGGTSCTVTLSVTPGQFAVCGMGSTDTTAVFSCSDSDGDTITHIPTSSPYANTGTAFSVGVVEGSLTHTNASEIFTCTRTTSSFQLDCVVAVYSGTPTSGWDVAFAGNSQNAQASGGVTLTTGTTTSTANASELAIAVFIIQVPSSFTFTPAGGYTVRSSVTNSTPFYFMDLTLTSTGTQQASGNGNWTGGPTNNNSTAAISTIK